MIAWCELELFTYFTEKLKQYRKELIQYYNLNEEKCMLTGIPGEGQDLTAGHILWPATHNMNPLLAKHCLTLGDVESARNRLLLLTSIKDMFGTKQICFVYNPLQV